MEAKEFFGAVTVMLTKIAIVVAIVVVMFKLSTALYDFGYYLFGDLPMALGAGTEVQVIISEDKSSMDVAKILEQKGLVRSALQFFVQVKLSEVDDEDICAGIYDLSTDMSPSEILEMITTSEE